MPTEGLPHPLTPADEGRHTPDADVALWNESWYLDFATADGRLGGYVRYSLYPNEGVAWLWACLVGEERDLLAAVDHHLALPDDPDGMDLDAGSVRLRQEVAEPFGEVTVHLETPATRFGEPGHLYTGEAGDAAHLTFDLTWAPQSRPYPYPGLTRYEVPCTVTGRVVVDGEVLEVAADGERDHSWGHRDWWAFPWIWTSGRLDDGTFVHGTRPDIPGVDYQPAFVVPSGGPLVEADRFEPRHQLEDGLPSHTDADLHDLRLRITPLHSSPLRLDAPDGRTTRLVRALCRFDDHDGGRSGYGWTEWNQPQPG
jgi:hypothetical protein